MQIPHDVMHTLARLSRRRDGGRSRLGFGNAESTFGVPCQHRQGRTGRVRLQMEHRGRGRALFNLGIDGTLRGCDLVALRVRDGCHRDQLATRAIVMQHKTQRPMQFEVTQVARDALKAWIKQAELKPEDFLSPGRPHDSPHLGARQDARILGHWVEEPGLDRAEQETHSMRRTRATPCCCSEVPHEPVFGFDLWAKASFAARLPRFDPWSRLSRTAPGVWLGRCGVQSPIDPATSLDSGSRTPSRLKDEHVSCSDVLCYLRRAPGRHTPESFVQKGKSRSS